VTSQELFQQAQARAAALERPRNSEAELERLRAECLAFFDSLPEPPLYPRLDDPARRAAAERLPMTTELLARCLALGKDASLQAQTAPLREAIEAHAAALVFAVDGRVRAAEEAWLRAQELERRIGSARRLWMRSDDRQPPVFDRKNGSSRFDPRPAPTMTLKLICPSCQAVAEFSVSPRQANHPLKCARCKASFDAYVAEVRGLEVQARRGARRYTFKVMEPAGALKRVEFEDASGAEFNVARRDLMAFLYSSNRELRGVLNLSNGRLLRLQRGGFCFVAAAVLGERAPELATFRAYRDNVLLQSVLGLIGVRVYYRGGPVLARRLEARPWARRLVLRALRWLYRALARRGYR